ncbi:MAG: heavy-metal-associated domain-containing protein [Prevotellaceae bacterium]|jgi:copper chaperone CopZ|nr:heavy-metal-associated domain-containing protein [Prevotellaceae bacterium]
MKHILLPLVALGLMLASAETLNAADKKLKAGQTEVTFKTDILSEHCKLRVEKVIPFQKGVDDMDIQIADGTVKVVFRTAKTSVENIKKAIEKMDYTVEVVDQRTEPKQEPDKK